jgi:uncharacterized circularly permuted ATP-grasp superfamily protein/uncharacterized alpha-E superfamily protein
MPESTAARRPPAPAQAGAARAHDECTGADGRVRAAWRGLAGALLARPAAALGALQRAADGLLAEQGATFNAFSDAGGAARPWQIDVIPLAVAAAEWQAVAAGVAQRMRLLEAVLADIHGPARFQRDGLLPPALVHANTDFLPLARGISPPGGRHLATYACDLARGPDGRWLVLRDHAQAPAGLGQALENRAITGSLLAADADTHGIPGPARFLERERDAVRALAAHRGEGASVVLLTPGFRSPAYFEHAFLARALGFPLVEGADLTVRERRVFLKTLDGLRPVDVILRRIDEHAADPLEMWTDSLAGVAGLAEAWRSGHVALANGLGTGLAESPALAPILPALCRAALGADLQLASPATLWLGRPADRAAVLRDPSGWLFLPASPRAPAAAARPARLSAPERRRLLEAVAAAPHAWVAQAPLAASTAPCVANRRIANRPVIWRVFASAGPDGPEVLPGGLALVGPPGQPPALWPRGGGTTKDVWIIGLPPAAAMPPPALAAGRPAAAGRNPATEVPGRIGEQLFWLGRYAERTELATRLLRAALRRLSGGSRDEFDACLVLLAGSELVAAPPAADAPDALARLAALAGDPAAADGLPALVARMQANAAAARDRLSDDTWRLIAGFAAELPPAAAAAPGPLLQALDTLVLRLAALAGMQAENMTRGHGWRFLEIGRRLERLNLTAALLATAAANNPDRPALLDPLLEACDSSMTYRRRHWSRPCWPETLDLLAADRANPRALASQTAVLAAEVAQLPGHPEAGLLPDLRALAGRLDALPGTRPAAAGAGPFATGLRREAERFGDLLASHYFTHAVRRVF